MNLEEKIKTTAVELTRIRSIVGTAGEIDLAAEVAARLARLPYFQARPQNLRLLPVRDDELGRQVVLALVEGGRGNRRTLVGLGHIDTVGVSDFAEMQPDATEPERLKQRLPETKFSEPALSEIRSPDWLLGRGILDMKTGVAALMAMVEHFAARAETLAANFVFLALPDEEGNSAGMLSAVQDLAELQTERGWEFIGAIDTDYTTFRYPGDENRYVYVGTTGKLLPCFYIYGEETHVGEPFNGLDANLLASEVMQKIDLNTELCDIADGEVALPPISLHQRDTKPEYSVQTANAVPLGGSHADYPDAVAAALKALRDEGVDGPFAMVLSEQLYRDLTARTDGGYPILSHVQRLIDGDVHAAPGLEGGLVISLRGGDFELTVGQDFSIGYLDHDAERVRLYIEESFTFLVLSAQAAIPLSAGGATKGKR